MLFRSVGKSMFGELKVGAELPVAVLGNAASAGAKQHRVLELSARASTVDTARAGAMPQPSACWADLVVGSTVLGAVQEVADDHIYVALSPGVRGRAHILHASSDIAKLAALRRRFAVGTLAVAIVLAVDATRQRLDLSLLVDANSPKALLKGAPNPPVRCLQQNLYNR